jgi:hypothetical protein
MYYPQGKEKQKRAISRLSTHYNSWKTRGNSTNEMVNIDRWNASKGRLIGTVEETRRLNHMLDNFEHKARKIYNRQLLNSENFTAESIKMKLRVSSTRKEPLCQHLRSK